MPQIYLRSSTAMPAEVGDGVGTWAQADEFGAQAVRNEEILWTEQGTYFKAVNQTTPGTGILAGLATSFSDTGNITLIMRSGSTTKKIIPHYFRLICTNVGAAATSVQMMITTDTVNRYSTGGTDLTTAISNSNTAQTVTSVVDVLRFGGITALAPVNKRVLSRSAIKTQASPALVLGDEIKIQFGNDADQGPLSSTVAARYVMNAGPIIIGGQNHSMLFHMWYPAATTSPQFEFEFAWWER